MSIHEVARRAGVSIATVSRTINHSSSVTADKASRVWAAIQELNYHPNTQARALVSGYSRILGLIVSDITNPFFPELVHEFEEAGTELDYTVLVSSTSYKPERMATSVRRMLEHKAEGVAIMTSEMDAELVDKLSRSRVPLVFLDVGRIAPGISNLRVDYCGGIGQAMSHLIDLAHRRIAFIAGPAALTSARVRRAAFVHGLEAHQIAVGEWNVVEGDHTVEGGFAAMDKLLALPTLPTAVLASNDLTAIGSLRAIRARGLRVPEDISLIGFDDIQLAAYTEPPLTTVRLDRKELARKALDALLALTPPRRGKEPRPSGAELSISSKLIVRASTAKLEEHKCD